MNFILLKQINIILIYYIKIEINLFIVIKK